MTTIIAIFCLSLLLSIILTPFVGRFATRFNMVDMPSKRKVHKKPIPRAGGIAIFLAFYLCFVPAFFYRTKIFDYVINEPRIIYILIGACLAFGLGLWDDIRRLDHRVKFVAQALAAFIAYLGGIRIDVIGLPEIFLWHLGWMSLPVTILWILMVINAINLIDGLDGLAAGVSFLVSIILLVLCILAKEFLVALGLAALAGATFGFLKYNFNPARIFMGDSGSYFLGYMLATLSILGSIESQTALSLLIPMIALGLPLMDTIWATIRRFILGKRLFYPDKGHFHHMLLKLGLTQRRSVMILYGITIIMGLISLIIIHAQDDRAALLLLLVGLIIIFGIRKLGYFKHIGADNIYRWMKDLSDEAGFTNDRRSFLNLQINIRKSRNFEQLWINITEVLEKLDFDKCEFYSTNGNNTHDNKNNKEKMYHLNRFDRRKNSPSKSSIIMRKNPTEWCWTRNTFTNKDNIFSRYLFILELPLLGSDNVSFGTLVLFKDMRNNSLSHYSLKRVEHFRRTIITTLEEMPESGVESRKVESQGSRVVSLESRVESRESESRKVS